MWSGDIIAAPFSLRENDHESIGPPPYPQKKYARAVLLMRWSLKSRFPAGMTTRKTKVLHTSTESALIATNALSCGANLTN
jgi:hypothetical protein